MMSSPHCPGLPLSVELFLSDIKLKTKQNNERTEPSETWALDSGALGHGLWDVGVTAALTGEWEVSHLLLPPEQGLKISSS